MLHASLRALHQSLGARFTPGPSGERIAGYSHLASEYLAMRQSCAVADRSDRAKVRVIGPDRVAVVQGLVTNDVKRLPERRALYTAMLTVKGHMVSDARLVKLADSLLLDAEPGLGPELSGFFNRFIISEDAEAVDVTEELGLLSFLGPRAREAVGAVFGAEIPALEEFETLELDGALLVGARLTGEPGVDVIVALSRIEPMLRAALDRGQSLGLLPIGEKALEVARVESGRPRFGRDMTSETIPLEAGLERAISFDKGCYLGQEVIARATFRGQVRRKLTGFAMPHGPVGSGTELFKEAGDAKAAGVITSVVESPGFGWIGLGYVRREHLAAGTELLAADGTQMVVRPLPFTMPRAG